MARKVRLRRTKVPTGDELDTRWTGLAPEGEEALLIGAMEQDGITPDLWNALAGEDKAALARAYFVVADVEAAVETLMTGEEPGFRRKARKYLYEVFMLGRQHERVKAGFLRHRRARNVFDDAIECRNALHVLLDQEKAASRHDQNYFEMRNIEKRLSTLRQGREGQCKYWLSTLEAGDLKALESTSPKMVAAKIAARCFGVAADDVRLGRRR